jgi:hypothetical protein
MHEREEWRMLSLRWIRRTWLAHWADAELMYCPRCKREMPFKKSVWNGALVCQKCGYEIK